MRLTDIKIVGYKSIDELSFPLSKRGKIGSYTTILLGKNETGKSNILDAMATPILADTKKAVDFLKMRNKLTKPTLVSIFFTFNLEGDLGYREYILESVVLPDELMNALNVSRFVKEIYLQNGNATYSIDYDFVSNKPSVRDYSYAKVQETITQATTTVPAKTIEKVVIKATSELDEEEKTKYAQLDNEQFREVIMTSLSTYANQVTIPVDIWKASPEYLIQDKIQLKDFAEDLSNIPLKNMFFLAGQKTKNEIAQKISEIEKDDEERFALADTLTQETTKYLNKKWKDHEIKIKVEIESDLTVFVSVMDKYDDRSRFSMSDRSQGFKQFVSLLLSVSVSNASGDIKNHLILIDEPEVHLHPSGIRWMLDELLEIGKNNYLFISTHSDFMLDRDTKSRHYLLTKGKDNLTRCRQIKTEEDINDDEILKSAFGINVIADFLSKHKLLVEGMTDKTILLKALRQVNKDHDIVITNGTGDNVVGTASLISFHGVNPMVVVDDDDAGREMKVKIVKISSEYKKKVLTIRDLNGSIIDKGTIEDCLPIDFVQSKANEVLVKNNIENISLDNSSPFCSQISLHLNQKISESTGTKKDKKEKIDKIIMKIKIEVSKYDGASITDTKTPKLRKLAEAILSEFGIS